MFKCSNGHENADTAKFCGECGAKAPTTESPLTKCGACQVEQPNSNKFCGGCGTEMATAVHGRYTAALEALGTFHKSLTALPARVEVKPGDHKEAEDALAKARTAGAQVDPLGELFIKAQNILSDHVGASSDETRTLRREVGEGLGLVGEAMRLGFDAGQAMTKAQIQPLLDEMRATKALLDPFLKSFNEWLQKPGRARSAQVIPIVKSQAAPADPDAKDESIRGGALIKAAIDLETAGQLSSGSGTLTQMLVNAGFHTLQQLTEENPSLGTAIERGLAAKSA